MDNKEKIFNEDGTFVGFVKPKSNFFRLPNNWTNMSAQIKALSEMKVIEYVARHTWGFTEEGFDGRPKKITTDEFVSGRKYKDSTRMDKGTGLSEKSVIDGLKRAVAHKFLVEFIDRTDGARIKKSYALKMQSDGEEGSTDSDGQLPSDDDPKDKIDSESAPSPSAESDSTAKNRDLKNLQSTRKNLPGDLKNLQSVQRKRPWKETSLTLTRPLKNRGKKQN